MSLANTCLTAGEPVSIVFQGFTSATNLEKNLNFSTPVQGFGAYLTGVGTASGNLHVVFADGGNQDLSVTGSSSGGVQFWGVTSPNSAIASVSLQMRDVISGSRDIFGIDDVRLVSVPEPATMSLLGISALGLLARRRSVRS